MVARGFQSASHPILAQIVPIRRCNLACTYCNEYDKHSPPVALATMRERIDHLARLRTANIEISGGEPLLHPDLDELIRHIRGTGALAGLITNGYLLNEKRIERFNNAGLDHLQISIDNVKPDDIVEEEPEGARREAADAGEARRVQRQHQLCARWRLEQPRGRTDDREAGDRTGSHGDGRPDPQRSRPPDTADAGAVARLQRDHLADGAVLHGPEPERFPAEPRARAPERLAVRGRRPLSLHLRGRPRALVLTAARASRDPAGRVHHRGCAAREHEREELCAALHRVVRAPRGAARPHSHAANRRRSTRSCRPAPAEPPACARSAGCS